MRRLSSLWLATLASALVWTAGCSEPGKADPDAGGDPPDATVEPADAAAPPGADAGVPVPLAGFGTISGECGVLDVELTDPSPYFFVTHLDFGADPYDAADLSKLTPGGQTVATDPNAGGSSQFSETFAFEVLGRCELATLLKTEMQVHYTVTGKMTDFEVEMDGTKIGVSVVRAMSYPLDGAYTTAQATTILNKKLQGILDSTANVAPEDKWQKQVLSVIAYSQMHADAVRAAWDQMSATLRADTILFVTVTDGDDTFIYTE